MDSDVLVAVIGTAILILNLIGVIGLGIAIEHWFLTLVGYIIVLGVIGNINENVMVIVIIVVSVITLIAMIRQIVIKGKRDKLLKAVKNGDKSTVSTFISKGVDVADWYYGKETPLVIAFENNDIEMINILLNNINHLNYTPNNPLCMATQKGYKDIISLLIEKGANVNYEPARALDFTKDTEIINLLRRHGAKTQEEIEKELKEEQARKEEEERKEAERKKKEELEKETKYWQDLLIQRNRKIVCKECKTELDKCSEVCPTCGKKIVTVVGKENDCNFSTIQEALDSVEEDAIIKVKPGIYEEHLHFSKKVHLIGCTDTIINKSSNALPIVVFDSSKSCEIDVPVEIEGIIFTHKKDLHFDTVSSFIKTSLYFEADKEVSDLEYLFVVNSNSSFLNIAILCSDGHGINFCDTNSIVSISYLHHMRGLGIFIEKNTTSLIDSCIISNSYSTGIYCCDASSPKIHNCKICNNGEDGSGGVAITDKSVAIIDACKIHDGKLGLACAANSNPKITNTFIFGHIQGISVEGNSSGIYEDCSIYSNKQCGLGICDESKPIINKCKFFSNGQNGIIIGGEVSPQVNNSEITNNGENYAGILCLENSRIYMKDSKSYGPKSYGIHLAHNAAGRFENCEFNGVKEDSDYISEFISCRQVY